MRRLIFLTQWLLLGAFGGGPLHAHGLPIGGLVPFLENGQVVGAGTTWGIVLEENGKWLRSCEEGSGATARFYHRAADGRVLVASDAGLFVTRDGGCIYEEVSPALVGHAIGALTTVRNSPQKIFVATRTPGALNGVFWSEDGGVQFTSTTLVRAGTFFDGIISTDDGQTLLVHALDFATLENLVFVSRDGGETFEEMPAVLEPYAYVRLLGTTREGDGLIVAGLPASGGNVVLVSTDGFVTATELFRIDDEVTAFARVGDVDLLALSGTRLMRRAEGEEDFVQVVGPTRCLDRFAGAEPLFACGSLPDNAHLLSTTDGLQWEPHIPFIGVEERQCPEGTPGYDRCLQYIFPEDATPSAPRSTPKPDQETPARCSCLRPARNFPAVGGAAFLLLLGTWLHRSRTRRGGTQ